MITTFNSKSVNAEPACNSPHTFQKKKKNKRKGKVEGEGKMQTTRMQTISLNYMCNGLFPN